ncbi:hypothetical protein [Streptomyces sp. JW3]|uniref:hypothetical protein n=1 Tax=Streptomyces sp. JW3 TaxID=3456955 RepID=UPI003FA478B5
MEVEDIYGQLLGVTAAVVDWRLEPHPQTPSEGNQVHFRYRFAGADETSDVADDACAVDKERVVLGCETVYAAEAFGPSGDPTGDAWLDIERPGKVTGVPLIPNEQDVKDGGGAHPPEPPSRGERL